jgi:hypothetical protein
LFSKPICIIEGPRRRFSSLCSFPSAKLVCLQRSWACEAGPYSPRASLQPLVGRGRPTRPFGCLLFRSSLPSAKLGSWACEASLQSPYSLLPPSFPLPLVAVPATKGLLRRRNGRTERCSSNQELRSLLSPTEQREEKPLSLRAGLSKERPLFARRETPTRPFGRLLFAGIASEQQPKAKGEQEKNSWVCYATRISPSMAGAAIEPQEILSNQRRREQGRAANKGRSLEQQQKQERGAS